MLTTEGIRFRNERPVSFHQPVQLPRIHQPSMMSRFPLLVLVSLFFVTSLVRADGLVSFVTISSGVKYLNTYSTSGEVILAEGVAPIGNAAGIARAGNDLFVADFSFGLRKYTTSGEFAGSLVSGSGFAALNILNNQIYLSDRNDGVIGVYGFDGSVINSSLITGLVSPENFAISNGFIYVIDGTSIGKYTVDGTAVSSALVSGLNDPTGIAVIDNRLFITDLIDGTVVEYTTSGTLVNDAFITGLTFPNSLAVFEDRLYVSNGESTTGSIGIYDLSGEVVDDAFLTGLGNPSALLISSVPEPASAAAWLGAFALVMGMHRRSRKSA
jgi:hypothetical protein